MHPIHTRIFFLLLFSSSLVAATNFTQCLQDFMSDPNAVGGVDSKGQPTSPAEAVGLTYEACTELCGTGPEAFNWRTFAQLFSAWLLPWLALISQLPFGSGNYVDDFVSGKLFIPLITNSIAHLNDFHTGSVVLSLGSPALAAYSLVLTSLNTRSAYRKVKRAELQNKIAVTRALISVQQAPLELTTDGRLLASIPDNGHWGQEIKERLYRRNAWSVATASSIAWVVIAYLFTLVDSFVSLNDGTNNPSEGQAVGTIWLWLICLVIGWLWVPTFTHGELKSAIRRANEKAAKKAAKMIKQKASHAYSSVKTKISHGISKEISILTGHEQPRGQPVADPVPEVDEDSVKVEIETIEEDTRPTGEEVGLEHIPLPDLAYDQPSASLQLPVGSQHDHGHLTVSASLTINHSSLSVQSSICPQKHRLLTDIDKGLGQLNRDEHRFGATFNYSRFIRHRVLVDAVLKALDKFAHEKDEVGLSRNRLIFEVVSLTFNRTMSLRSLPSLQGPCSLLELSLRCSSPRFSLLFFSVDRPPQLQ